MAGSDWPVSNAVRRSVTGLAGAGLLLLPALAWGQTITTVAGNGTASYSGDGGAATSASINGPSKVFVDVAGNIYFSDAGNLRVRKVDTSGNISTVAGNGTAGTAGDGGAATSANLYYPRGVFIDGSGGLYIGQEGIGGGGEGHRVRKVTSGIITTIAGAGPGGYSGDGGPAVSANLEEVQGVYVDGSGNVYFADRLNHRIRKIDTSGNIATFAGNGTAGYSGDGGAATSASLNSPLDVHGDGAGNIYIADGNNHRIRKVSTTGTITTVAGNGTAGFSGDGGGATSASLNLPAGLHVDSAGNIYIADQFNHRIRKVDTSGNISTVAGNGTAGFSGDGGTATSASLQHPGDVFVDGQGNLYIADQTNHRVRKVTVPQPDLQIAGKIAFLSLRDGYDYEIYTMNADGTNQIRLTNTSLNNASATNSNPWWSPDGTKVAFNSNRDGNPEVYVMNADGTDPTRLTNNAAPDWPTSWSPDGTKIAFVSGRDGDNEVYVMDAAGTNQTRLTNNSGEDGGPCWSPDGTKIAFHSTRDGNGEIYVMSADGTNQTRLTNNPESDTQPAWSPDGTKIAFRSYRDGNHEVYAMNADGANQIRLTSNSAADENPSWSPDGTKIAYHSARDGNVEVYLMNADGSIPARLTNNSVVDGYPSWGEAFRRIGATSVGSPSSRSITIQNTGSTTLNVSSITSSDGQFAVSPTNFSVNAGGSQVVTVTFTPTSAGVKYGTLTISSNDPDASTARLTVNGTGQEPSPVYSGPTSTVNNSTPVTKGSSGAATFTVTNTGGGTLSISNITSTNSQFAVSPASFNLSGGASQTVTATFAPTRVGWEQGTLTLAHNAAGSPATVTLSGIGRMNPPYGSLGQTRIAFGSNRGNNWDIYVMNIDGTGQTRLTQDDAEDAHPMWSPDAQRVAFQSTRGSGLGIWAMSADGSSPVRLGQAVGDQTPAWSPDGAKIAFAATGERVGIWTMNADGSGQMRLTENSAEEVPSWSPDGTKIAFHSRRDGNYEIYVMDANGSNQTRLTYNAAQDAWPCWSPDGTIIAFHSNRDGNHEIYAMGADGSAAIRLTNNAATDANPRWSPDGARIVYQTDRDGNFEIYTMNADGSGQTRVTNGTTYEERASWSPFVTSHPPTATPQSTNTDEDAPKQITLAGNDPNGDALVFAIGTQPTKGTVTLNGATATYVPNANLNGADSFTFTASDAQTSSAAATVSITIIPVNDPPVLGDLVPQTINEDAGPQSIALTTGPGGGSDEAGQTVTVTAISSNAALIPNPTISGNTLSYAPAANASGTATITVTANDGQGANNTTAKSFTVTVTPVNDLPVLAAIGNKTVDEGQTLTATLSATDADGDPLSFAMSGAPAGAVLTGAIFTWTPTYEQAGTYALAFAVADGKGGSDSEGVQVEVTEATPPGLIPSPLAWAFGDVPAGTRPERTFLLRNPGSNSVRVDSLVSSSSVFSVVSPGLPRTINARDSLAVLVRFTPPAGAKEAQQGSLTVSSTAGRVTVLLSGRGVWIGFVVRPDTLDFGRVRVGNTQTRSFTVSNLGNVRLAITSTEISNSAFSVDRRAFNVEGGDSTRVQVSFAAVQERSESGTLMLTGNATQAGIVTVRGVGVRPPVPAVSPSVVDLGNVRVDASRTRLVVVKNASADTLRVSTVSGLQLPFVVAPSGVPVLAPGDSSLLSVQFSPAIRAGFRDTLVVSSEGGTVEVPVLGRGVQAVLSVPDSLAFDATRIGDAAELNLIVSNLGDDTLKVTGILSDKPQVFQVETAALNVPANNVQPVKVRFVPAREGRDTGSLTCASNVGQKLVRLIGTGTTSVVAIRLIPAEFGIVRVGQTERLQVFLVNRGSSAVTIDSVLVVPPAAPVEVVGAQLPVSISARDSMEVASLVFGPRTAGSLSGVSLRVVGRGIDRSVQVRGQVLAGPRLVVDQDSLVWTSVSVNASGLLPLRISNTGGDTLHISQFSFSTGVFSTPAAGFSLAPGLSRSIDVVFAPSTYGRVDGRLEIASDDPASPYVVTLRGATPEKLPVLSAFPADTLRFGIKAPGESERKGLRLRNRGGGVLKVVLRSESGEFVAEVSDTIRLAAADSQTVLIRFQPEKGGRRQSSVLLWSNDAQVPSLSLVVVGTGGGVRFEPPSVEFGEVVVGARVDTTVYLLNQTSARVSLTLDQFGSGFTLDRRAVILEAGQSAPLKVGFQPGLAEAFTAKVEGREQSLSLTLFGTGVQGPRIRVQPATLRDFGQVAVGQVARGSLTVTNEGQGLLKVFDLVTTRLEYRVVQADSLPLLIQPGGERRLDVEFTPLGKGEVTGTLTVVSNDPNNRELVRVLNGRGVEVAKKVPKLDLAWGIMGDLLDFGQLAPGEAAEQSFLIRNLGDGVLQVQQIESGDEQVWAEPESLVVLPGGSREVVLKVRPQARAPVEGLVRILSNDPDKPAVRKRWMYALPVPKAVVLTEALRFGPGDNGRRSAPLAVWNRGSAPLIVELVDDSGQLQFAKDRLAVEPDQVGRSQVFYRGSGGTGTVVLASNDPGQRQLAIPWQAEPVVELLQTVPADRAVGVERQTVLSLFFNQPLRQQGQLGGLAGQGGGLVSLQARIVPEPLNPWRRQVKLQGTEVQIPLELAPNQSYRLIVVDAEGQSGSHLGAPFELSFSTGAAAPAPGRIAGKVLFADGSALAGTVFLASESRELVGSARIGGDGSYTLDRVPAGTYSVFAQEEGTTLSVAYDTPVQVNAGETVRGVDLTVPAQEPAMVAVAPIDEDAPVPAEAALAVDSTFVVPIRTDAVQDLTGFAVQVSFDPAKVVLVEVTPDSGTVKNALYGAGGFPVFLTRVVAEGSVEFGGSLLGAKARTAPDDGGLLALFTFRALRTDAEVTVDRIVRRTLRGEDVMAGPRVRLKGQGGKGADFDGDGTVGFSDFFQFADAFGKPATGEAAKFDLDGSGTVDFGDFFQFADAFGKAGGSTAKLLALARERLGLPAVFELGPAYPNPFNAEVTVEYQLPGVGPVRLGVYDLLGQRVHTLVEQEQQGGWYRVTWDGREATGKTVASGVYFCRLQAGLFTAVRKVVLLR